MVTFWQTISSIRWTDVLDILLNSYLLFRLYILFRGTNVIRMLLVIVGLGILKWIATSLGMIVMSWVIQGIIAVAALIIIIVFRNEIASVFKVQSLKSLFWGIPQRQSKTHLDIIADSVEELARQKLGALIVLPLKKDIDDVVYDGVTWQGTISQEMLLSIFWHGSPVHDGAAVIQGDRVTKVSTILPLSHSSELPSHFGTRHRAALGLTEHTDALVLVVSEERGEITLFKDQSITPVRDKLELLQLLGKYTGTTPQKGNSTNELLEFRFAALACLLLVSIVWYSFARGLETFTTLEIPVEFMNRAPETSIISTSVSNVKIQVSGSGSLIKTLTPDQIRVKINLADASVGSNDLPITVNNIVLPPGISLKQIEPETLTVELDVPGQKKLPIQPVWTGKLPEGLRLQSSSSSPDTVEVRGGKQVLAETRAIYTEAIALDNLTESGKITVGLMPFPPSLKPTDDSFNTVEVSYTIAPRLVSLSSEESGAE